MMGVEEGKVITLGIGGNRTLPEDCGLGNVYDLVVETPKVLSDSYVKPDRPWVRELSKKARRKW